MKTYTIVYQPEENGWWFTSIKEIQGCHTQGKNLAQARKRIEEALELFVDDLSEIQFIDDIQLPQKEQKLIQKYLKAQKEIEKKRQELQELSQAAAKILHQNLSMSNRDTGQLMQISHQRVNQLINS